MTLVEGLITGIGLDIVDLARFRLHYGSEDPDLMARCFTETELADVGSDPDRLDRLAARFAAKEAAFKALGGGHRYSIHRHRSSDCGNGSANTCLNG